jgi:hypothetical protein
MLLLSSTSDKLQLITGSSGTVDVHISWVDLLSGAVTPGRTNTNITTATTTDIVASPAASTTRNIKTLIVSNNHASTSNLVTVQHTDGTHVVPMQAVTLAAGERLQYTEGVGFQLTDSLGVPRTNTSPMVSVTKLSGDVSNSTATLAALTGLQAAAGVGTWMFEYYLVYQSAATSTGVRFSVNHTGTVTSFVANARYVDATATASTAAPSQAAVAATASVMGAFSARAKATTGWGSLISTDAAASDMLMIVEGITIVTVAGNLELWHGSETTAASTVKAGSALRLTRISG